MAQTRTVSIDTEKCSKCGTCFDLCPNRVFAQDEQGIVAPRADRTWACFACGQCMAACPTKAVSTQSLDYNRDFFPLPNLVQQTSDAAFDALIQSRRATRSYRRDPVPRAALQRIVDAMTFAPPGFPPLKTELIVVGNPELMKKTLPYMVELYDVLNRTMKNPVARLFVRREVGPRTFRKMTKHLLPLLEIRLPDLKAGTENTITRDAPAMILLLADDAGEDLTGENYVAATYGMLAAHAYGLGSSIMDIIPPAINKKKELRELFGIPVGKYVEVALILGYPKHVYRRGIKRDHHNVTWL